MIISHKHRFIFIKTRKTAGTSVEISLSRYCGSEDIITPITLEDEPLRGVLGLSAQNYYVDGSRRCESPRLHPIKQLALRVASSVELKRQETLPYRVRRWVSNHASPASLHGGNYFNHISAAAVISLLGRTTWNDYFCFCFERDPLTKTLSDYRYRASGKSFEEYISTDGLPVDWDKYTENNKPIVDFVGRFESLTDDLTKALAQVGLEFDGWLPRAKQARRSNSDLELCPDQMELVRRAFAREYSEFHYLTP